MTTNPPTPKNLGVGVGEGKLCLYIYEYLTFIKFLILIVGWKKIVNWYIV